LNNKPDYVVKNVKDIINLKLWNQIFQDLI
jgi:hypothetical protein